MERTLTKQIADCVAAAIHRSGKSQSAVALATGIPKTTLGRKINGHTDFTMTELVSIAFFLDTTIAELTPSAIPLLEKVPA